MSLRLFLCLSFYLYTPFPPYLLTKNDDSAVWPLLGRKHHNHHALLDIDISSCSGYWSDPEILRQVLFYSAMKVVCCVGIYIYIAHCGGKVSSIYVYVYVYITTKRL